MQIVRMLIHPNPVNFVRDLLQSLLQKLSV